MFTHAITLGVCVCLSHAYCIKFSLPQSSNVVVVSSQPTPVVATTVIRPAGDYYLTLSIVLTVICLFCGTWYSLFCTIPAIIMATSVSNHEYFVYSFGIASQARDAAARGDLEGAQSKGRIALILNIVACVWWVVALIIIVAAIAGSAANASSNSYCYRSSYGYYYYYYCYK